MRLEHVAPDRHGRHLGGDPEKAGSVAGSLHRGWMNVKAAVTGGSEAAILNAAESGEDSAKKAYEDALGDREPPGKRALPRGASVHSREGGP